MEKSFTTAQHDEWLSKAEDDLKFAEVGLREGFFAQVCFLSQQCIEKGLKGSLVFLGRSYPRGHNLCDLVQKIPELKLGTLRGKLGIIDGYYVPLRYPDAAPGMKKSGPPNKEEAKEALETAWTVFGIVARFCAGKNKEQQ